MVVAVIGAGPAGASASLELERLGIDYILLDKSRFPRNKPCGGVLPFRVLEEFEIPEEVVERPLKGYRLIAGDLEVKTRFPSPGAIIDRKTFDSYLLTLIGKKPEKFRVRRIEQKKDSVIIYGDEKIEASYVIGCDGANSAVRKSLGIEYPRFASAFQYVFACEKNLVDSTFGDWFEVHYLFSKGYGWVSPLRDRIRVGVGGIGFTRKKLDEFVSHLGERLASCKIAGYEAHRIPMGGVFPGRGRVALAGDAAGTVFPGTGEGIYYAMISGILAARAVKRAMEGEALMQAYTRFLQKRGLLDLSSDFLDRVLSTPESAKAYLKRLRRLSSRE